MKQYRVTHIRHFIGGRMVFPDRGDASIVTLPKGVEPGKHLVELKGTAEPAATTPHNPATKGFVAKHAGGGHYRIEDAQGERVGDFSGTKEEAEAEAARMNAGDPDLDDLDNGLPDA